MNCMWKHRACHIAKASPGSSDIALKATVCSYAQLVGGELRGAWIRAASFGEEHRDFYPVNGKKEHLGVNGEECLLMVVHKFSRD